MKESRRSYTHTSPQSPRSPKQRYSEPNMHSNEDMTKFRRKLRKNDREKQRRSELSYKFSVLCSELHLGRYLKYYIKSPSLNCSPSSFHSSVSLHEHALSLSLLSFAPVLPACWMLHYFFFKLHCDKPTNFFVLFLFNSEPKLRKFAFSQKPLAW